MVDVIEHYGGTVGIHRKMTENCLSVFTEGVYDKRNWRSSYTDQQISEATEKGKEKILARMFLTRANKVRYGGMLTKLQNDYITGRQDVYPDSQIAAFSLLNNWHCGYKRGLYMTGTTNNGTSFAQDGAKRSIIPSCWGCGKEGVMLSQCNNESCMKRFKAKQARKTELAVKTSGRGEQHFNAAKQAQVEQQEEGDGFTIDEYYRYDVGHEFHQTRDDQQRNEQQDIK
jgi:hypothetical protein